MAACLAPVLMSRPGQPASEQLSWPVLRRKTFHASFPIPSAGSPAVAVGTAMASWPEVQRGAAAFASAVLALVVSVAATAIAPIITDAAFIEWRDFIDDPSISFQGDRKSTRLNSSHPSISYA